MLSNEQFNNLAGLARLNPEDAGLKNLRDDFNKILNYVEKIKEIDTSSVKDLSAANETRNVVRADAAGSVLAPAVLSRMAPEWEAGHFVVPGVIESEG